MATKAITLGIRFVVVAALYVIVTSVWTSNAKGWESLAVFGDSIVLGFAAIPAWGAAVAISQFIPHPVTRLLAHPMLMIILFVIAAMIAGLIIDTPLAAMSQDLRPFVALIAVIATAEAMLGFLLERRLGHARTA